MDWNAQGEANPKLAKVENKADRSLAYIAISDDQPIVSFYYLKGISDGDKHDLNSIKITVCGLEKLTAFSDDEYH
jgi:hypothetical protein